MCCNIISLLCSFIRGSSSQRSEQLMCSRWMKWASRRKACRKVLFSWMYSGSQRAVLLLYQKHLVRLRELFVVLFPSVSGDSLTGAPPPLAGLLCWPARAKQCVGLAQEKDEGRGHCYKGKMRVARMLSALGMFKHCIQVFSFAALALLNILPMADLRSSSAFLPGQNLGSAPCDVPDTGGDVVQGRRVGLAAGAWCQAVALVSCLGTRALGAQYLAHFQASQIVLLPFCV